jgi:hypothetical protein
VLQFVGLNYATALNPHWDGTDCGGKIEEIASEVGTLCARDLDVAASELLSHRTCTNMAHEND